MKTEHPFEIEIESQLSVKKFEDVLQFLRKMENDAWLKNNVWNLINRVCITVKSNELLESDSDVDACRNILLFLVDKGKPKEVIVALMEEADSFKLNPYFVVLLEPLKRTLKNVPGKRGKSLEWVLSTLNAHIQLLALPEDLDLQGEEKLLLDTDPAVIDTNYVLTHYLPFLEAFVEEVSFETVRKSEENFFIDRVRHQRDILTKYLFTLLGYPLVYHDLHVPSVDRPKSTIRILAENCVKSLSKICANVFNLFDFADLPSDDPDSDAIPPLAFANLSYLIFVERIALHVQPFVHSHTYVFDKHLNYILLLLQKKENLVLFKGLHLAEVLLDRLEEFEIPYCLVELKNFTEFPTQLLNVAIYCEIEMHRKMALKMFVTYINKCDWKGRYHLILQVLDTSTHSGSQGVVINLYKSYLHESLGNGVSNVHFMGKNLILFLKKVFVLPDGVETDILENIDRIVTSLNLLRYLLIRDKKDEDKTGVWGLLSSIQKEFLDPLLMGLDLSRAHYKQAAKDEEIERKEKRDTLNSTVTVNKEVLPNIPPHFQKDILDRALVTFDMIESVLSRVRELL